ncbi:MAG: GNAT family N-acetyltransferase [Anaerolineae bacterium]
MLIRDLDAANDAEIEQAAAALVEGFRDHWPAAWPDMTAAREEVGEALEDGRVCRVACGDDGALLGWIGGRPTYARVWELHPLVVRPDAQGRGIGRALVADLERQVGARGGLTLMLGTDDEDGMTTLGGVNLYPDVLLHLARIGNLRRHPFEFYQTCGFVIVGVVPDANGFGKPDILMAKRVVSSASVS